MKKPQEKSAIDKYFDRKDRLNREIPELPIIMKLCLFFEIEPEDLRKELSLLVFGEEVKKDDKNPQQKKIEIKRVHSTIFPYGSMTDENAYVDVIGWLTRIGFLSMEIIQKPEGIELKWSIVDGGGQDD